MARIRTTKPEFWDDDIVGSLSRDARLLFVASWNFADDEGLIRWSPDYLKGAAFRYDDDITVDDVAAWMQEIEDAGFAYVYSTSRARHRIGFIVNFRRHQRIDKPQPAKLPVPNWRDPAVVMVYARRDGFACGHCGEAVNERLSQSPAERRYDPVCERIKPPSERQGAADDPSNIVVVHAMCAKDYDANSDLDSFRDHSRNVPGILQERSSGPSETASGRSTTVDHDSTNVDHAQGDTAGQGIPGTFHERSPQEGIRDQGKEGKEQNPCASADADGALFGADAAKPKRANPAARFAEFWAAYPLKKGKPAAEKNWIKAVKAGADPQAIIDGAIAYAQEIQRTGTDRIKYPQGWLTDGRWTDEYAPAPDAPATAPSPRPEWCGQCDPQKRTVEDADRHPVRCPRCHPLTQKANA